MAVEIIVNNVINHVIHVMEPMLLIVPLVKLLYIKKEIHVLDNVKLDIMVQPQEDNVLNVMEAVVHVMDHQALTVLDVLNPASYLVNNVLVNVLLDTILHHKIKHVERNV